MASSRLERVGTIFSRVEGLIRSGAMRAEDRPLWWDIYYAFPPIREPLYSRPDPLIKLRPILYDEDVIRRKFHISGEPLGVVNLTDDTKLSNAQKLIKIYREQKGKSDMKDVSEDELYSKCLNILKPELMGFRDTEIKQDSKKSEHINILQNYDTTTKADNVVTKENAEVIKKIFED